METPMIPLPRAAVASLAAILPLIVGANADAQVGGAVRLSNSRNGGNAAGESGAPTLSLNGRDAAFRSAASDIVEDDNNSSDDVFRIDRVTNQLTRVSVIDRSRCGVPGIVEGDGDSTNPAVSPRTANGFTAIVFESDATNLSCFPDTNGARDIFLHIPSLNYTERVSVPASNANLAPNGPSFTPSVAVIPSPNVIRIVYASDASNLTTNDGNAFRDVFFVEVPDTIGNGRPSTTRRLSTNGNGDSDKPKICGTGQFAVFESEATNLVPGVTTSGKQIFLANLDTGALELISRAPNGQPGNGDSDTASISYTGRFVTFRTQATNITSGVESGKLAVVRFDRSTGQVLRVNAAADGTPGQGTNSLTFSQTMSANGRFVAFTDQSTNLVPADTNGNADIFLKDLVTGAISRTNISFDGLEADGADATNAGFSGRSYNAGTGSAIYATRADNLVPGDTSTQDIFQNDVTLATLQFARGTKLEVPPDTAVNGKTITSTGQQFTGISKTPISGLSANGVRSLARKPRERISYEHRLVDETRRRTRKKLSRRNELTFRDLRAGQYRVSYRVITKRGDRVVKKTPFSPEQRFNIS